MTFHRPDSPFIDGSTTQMIIYTTNGKTFTEIIDLSLSGRTGLTKSITAKDQGKFFTVAENVTQNEELLEIAQNSTERETAYNKAMNERLIQADRAGNGEKFREALNKNGTLDIISGNKSINNFEIKSEDSINDANVAAEEAAINAEIQQYKESTQVKNEALYYPTNHQSDKGEDYIFIEQFEYEPPQPENLEGLDPKTSIISGLPRGENIKRDPTTIDKQNPNGKQIPRGSCKLPIPSKLGVSNGVSWGEAKANAVEMAAFSSTAGGIGKVISKEKNLAQLLSEGFKGTANVLKEIQDDFKESTGSGASASDIISATLARGVLGSIGINVDVDQFITRQTGAAINPNLELLFGGPQLRTFSFNFNFAPESTTEARMVRKIQRWFKQGMLPTRSIKGKSTLFLGSPNVFRIMYRNHGRRIKGLNLIKICALTSCQIDFTPDGTYQSYDDSDSVSMPVRTTMGLTFNELTPIFRDDYISDNQDPDPSLIDLGHMIEGANAIDENDIGF